MFVTTRQSNSILPTKILLPFFFFSLSPPVNQDADLSSGGWRVLRPASSEDYVMASVLELSFHYKIPTHLSGENAVRAAQNILESPSHLGVLCKNFCTNKMFPSYKCKNIHMFDRERVVVGRSAVVVVVCFFFKHLYSSMLLSIFRS